MVKKVCPNCGKPVKDTDDVCSNCGQKLKRASYKSHKKHKKAGLWIGLGLLVVILFGGYQVIHQTNKSAVSTSKNNQYNREKATNSETQNGATQNDKKSGWTKGIPTELVGDYTAYEGEHAVASLQFGKAVETIESDGSYLTYYLRKTNTRYYSNDIKSKRLGNGVYLLDYVAKVTVNGVDQGKVHKTEKLVVNNRSFSFIGLTFDKEVYSWIAPNSEADDARQEKPFPNDDNQDTSQTTSKNEDNDSKVDNTNDENTNKTDVNSSTANTPSASSNNETNKANSNSQENNKSN